MKELKRVWHIDVLHHSHTDVGYTVRQELAARQHAGFLRGAVEILRREDAEGRSGFRWQCENFWQVEQFLASADEAEKADFIRYARSHGVPVGPGRGSGAGSLCAYCIGITGIDPIKFDLLFERFLNPERVSMPDFDIDFCIEGRQSVKD